MGRHGFDRLDFALNGGMARTRGGRLVAVWHAGADGPKAYLVGTWSDDDGRTWRMVVLSNVVTQASERTAPDAIPRWENYCCEPTVDQRRDGTLQMFVRTSTDHNWRYLSRDGGETWTGPERLPHFFACNTMPTLLRLKDGRLMIHKTNDRGYLMVKAHPFAAYQNVPMRLYADVEVADAAPRRSFAFLRVYGRKEDLSVQAAHRKVEPVESWEAATGLEIRPAGAVTRTRCGPISSWGSPVRYA